MCWLLHHCSLITGVQNSRLKMASRSREPGNRFRVTHMRDVESEARQWQRMRKGGFERRKGESAGLGVGLGLMRAGVSDCT